MNVEAVEDFTPGVFVEITHLGTKGEGVGIKSALAPLRPAKSARGLRDGAEKAHDLGIFRFYDRGCQEADVHEQLVGQFVVGKVAEHV